MKILLKKLKRKKRSRLDLALGRIRAFKRRYRSLRLRLFLLFTLPTVCAAIAKTALEEYEKIRRRQAAERRQGKISPSGRS